MAGIASPAAVLALVLLVAAALRVAAVLTVGSTSELHGDEGYYVQRAHGLLDGTGYAGSLRPPGYATFLALVFALAGDHLPAARLAQVALSLATVALVFDLVRRRFGLRAGTISALFIATTPALVHYTHFLWSETLYVFCLMAALWCLDRFADGRRMQFVVLAGVALGMATMTREVALYFVPIAALWVWRVAARRLLLGARAALLLVAPVALLVVPWMLRNAALHGQWIGLSTNHWQPIAVGSLLPRGRALGLSPDARAFAASYGKVRGELQRAEYARRVAIETIAREMSPSWLARKVVRNTYLLFTPACQLTRFARRGWIPPPWDGLAPALLSVEAVVYALQLALGLVAIWLVPGGQTKLLVVALLLLQYAAHIGANATDRFRVPMLPLLSLYVGPLLMGIVARGRGLRWRIAGGAVCLAAFTAVLSAPLLRGKGRQGDAAPAPTAAAETTSARALEQPPSIVLISIDTLRADHLGAYGYERATSPHIDALAGRGTLFENAFSPTSWTLPAHASLLTGVSPYRHGAIGSSTRIRDDVPMLAELLRARGYATEALVNAPFVSAGYGFDRGFDRFTYQQPAGRQSQAPYHAAVLERVAAMLAGDRPAFVFVHYMDVHSPYKPPKRFNKFAPGRKLLTRKDRGYGLGALKQRIEGGDTTLDESERAQLIGLYDGEILAMDEKIGELADLTARAGARPAIVVVTSDHGEEFMEHGSLLHGTTLYDEVLHVPLIVAGPGIAAGRRVPQMVSLLDVAPSLLAMAGAPVPAGVEGRVVFPDPPPADDAVLALQTSSHSEAVARRGVRTSAVKRIQDDLSGKAELYDLSRDPRERDNLAPARRDDRVEQALARLVPERGPQLPKADPAVVESLKSLGYL